MPVVLAADDQNQLCCPQCMEPNGLHVDEVEMAGRPDGEDRDGLIVTVNARSAVKEKICPADHMVGRRHMVSIIMWCEVCGRTSTIWFQQHKGSTYVTTRSIRTPPPE